MKKFGKNFLSKIEKKIYPDKDKLSEYYIAQNHTKSETCAYFHIGENVLKQLIQYFNIQKDSSILRMKPHYNQIITFIDSNRIKIRDHIVTREEIVKLYLEDNISYEQFQKHYNISSGTRSKVLKYFNINKSFKKRFQNIQKTNLKRYGDTCANRNEKIKNKIKATNLAKYGTEWAIGSQIVQQHIIESNLKKYGVKHTGGLKSTQEVRKQNCLKKYGVEHPMQSKIFSNKVRATTLARYGVDNVMHNQVIKQRIENTCIQKYGVPNFMQTNIKHLDIWKDETLFKKFLCDSNHKYTIREIAVYFNLDDSTVWHRLHDDNLSENVDLLYNRSNYEDEIIKYLNSQNITNIQKNVKNILDNKYEIDIYLPDYKIGIEFNGDYWHSDIKFNDHNGRSRYHQNKSLYAESKGIFLFHIFEHEWSEEFTSVNAKFTNGKENIKNRLSSLLIQHSNKIPARKCKLVLINNIQQQKDFLNKSHIQGYVSSSIMLGLQYQDQLVSCMSFVPPKYNKYTWELNRFCTIHDTVVQGGASKLFKYFVNNYLKENETVVSYNDITKTKGTLYQILGFVNTNIGSPNYWWINFKTNDIRSRYQEQAAGEVERMHKLGYHRVCDCGTKTWVYTKTNKEA